MDKKLEEVLSGTAFTKVCAILRENDYTYTHNGGYDTFSPDDIEIIKKSLMQESQKERDNAQDYINFYNALMQYSNFISNSAANYYKEVEKLSIYIDTYEMIKQLGNDLVEYVREKSSVPFFIKRRGIEGLITINPDDGTADVDVECKGNLLYIMYKQSAKVSHSLAVLKSWIEVGKEMIGKNYKNPIMQLIPYNFADYIAPHNYRDYPDKYYILDENVRDSTKEDQKFKLFPTYKLTPLDPDGEKAARSILKITLGQWQLSTEKISAMIQNLKKRA